MDTNDLRNRIAAFDAKQSSTEEVASFACEIAAVVAMGQNALDALKPVLRERAAADKGTESHVQYEARAGKVSVTFPDPMYKPVKGLDWDGLRAALGDTFDTYFTTRVSYGVRKDIEGVVRTRSASAEISTVLGALSRDEPTPRVGFKPS